MKSDPGRYDYPPERRWAGQLAPQPVVASIIRRDPPDGGLPQYLLIRRNRPPYAGRWALVGGKWDFGETLASAASREAQEETGLATRFVALRGLLNERLAPAGPADHAGHFLIFVCELVAAEGEASEQAEGQVAWFTLADIDRLAAAAEIIPSDHAMIRHFAAPDAALPYYEAEMVAAAAAAGAIDLLRFERG